MGARAALAVLILAVAGLFARDLRAHREQRAGLPVLARLEASPAGWTSRDLELTPEVLATLGADAYVHRVYRREDGARVSVFVGYFAEQVVNSQIHSPRHCVPAGGWTVLSQGREMLPAVSGARPVASMVMSEPRGQNAQCMLYWFRTRGGPVTGEYALKWDLVKNSLHRRPTDAAFIRFFGAQDDRAAMEELIGALEPSLDAALGEVGL